MNPLISRRGRLAAGAFAAAAATAAAPAPANAANAVYGGSTRAGEAIVVKADKRAQRLKSTVISWSASCDGGMRFDDVADLTPTAAEPGFSPDPEDLMTSRNRGGRFAGTQLRGYDLGDLAAAVVVKLSGRLRSGAASGTLSAEVTIVDKASGDRVDSCRTGNVAWSATRAPGRVFGGKTSQEAPVVIRLDRRGNRVSDVILGWESSTCAPPENYVRFPERFSGFAMKGGRFGDAFSQSVDRADGGNNRYEYSVAGRVSGRAARGTFSASLTATDAGGATQMTCDSGSVSWSAVTG